MRLGVVGLLPNQLTEIQPAHLNAIKNLHLTGVGLSLPVEILPKITEASLAQVRQIFADTGMDLVQAGLGYRACLFDPDKGVRDTIITQIKQGLTIAKQLNAHVALIRTGSLSPNGPYSPSRQNHQPDCHNRLRDTLKQIATAAEALEQPVVIETHLLTIMDSPETNAETIAAIGSKQLGIVMDYTNHFQALHQVYNSTARINHIFDVMGAISVIGHCKDIQVRDGFVTHFDEAIPGEGELDLATAFSRWHQLYPNGYMMLEHLPAKDYPLACQNTHRILKHANIPVH